MAQAGLFGQDVTTGGWVSSEYRDGASAGLGIRDGEGGRTVSMHPGAVVALLALAMLLVGGFAIVAFGHRPEQDVISLPAEVGTATPELAIAGGGDSVLAQLFTDCADGIFVACDNLWAASAPDSPDAAFGATCGGVGNPYTAGECYLLLEDEPGESPERDALVESCNSGDMTACDTLRYSAPPHSAYYEIGASCGGTVALPNVNTCISNTQVQVGDDVVMDGYHAACGAGDWAACDHLAIWTQDGTEYYEFALTCGETQTRQTVEENAGCANVHLRNYGDSNWFDALYDGCAAGELDKCDWLARGTSPTSEYGNYGLTCGNSRELKAEWVQEYQTASGFTAYTAGEAAPNCDGSEHLNYGEDSFLDGYYDACASGNMLSCRRLGDLAPQGSEYQRLAATCGDTAPVNRDRSPGLFCWVPGGTTYGTDSVLDGLWDSCAAGTMNDCDELTFGAPDNSDYWRFGATCGGLRSQANAGICAELW